MAYGVKYSKTYADNEGNTLKLEILKDGYVGAETSINCGKEPVVLHWLGEGNDPFESVVIGSEAIISLAVDTDGQYNEILNGSARDYKVKVYKGGSVIWQGWIDPYSYAVPYADPNYIIELQAYDGIGDLKTKPFPDPASVGNEWYQSTIELISAALGETDLGLEIYIASDIKYTNDDGVTEKDFEDIYADYRVFYDGEFDTCYDVLQKLLLPFNMRVYQDNGRWYLDRMYYRLDGSCTYNKYTSAGAANGTAAADSTKVFSTTTAATLVRPLNGMGVEFTPIYKSFDIVQNMAEKRNILPANNFEGIFYSEEFNAVSFPYYWFPYGGLLFIGTTPGSPTDKGYLAFKANTTTPVITEFAESDKVEINKESLFTGKVSTTTEMRIYNDYAMSAGSSFVYMSVMVDETISGSTTTYYVTDAGTMTLTPTTLSTAVSEFNTWATITHSFTYMTSPITPADSVEVYIRVYPAYDAVGLGTVRETHLRKALVTWEQYNWYIQPEDIVFERTVSQEIDANNMYKPSDLDLVFGDMPVFNVTPIYGDINLCQRYSKLLYEGVFYDSADAGIDDWYSTEMPRDAGNKKGLITHIMRNQIFCHGRSRKQILSGDIYTDEIRYGSLIQDYGGKRYICNGVEARLKECIWSGEWVELWDQSTVDFGDYDASDFDDTDFWAI